MKKNLIKLIIAITAISLTVATVVGSITFFRSSQFLQREIKDNVQSVTEKYANQFSGVFNHMEGIVDSVGAFVSVTFDPEKLKHNPSYMEEYKEDLKDIVAETISSTTLANGLYVTFDPELTPNNDEVWYCYKDGVITYIESAFVGNTQEFDNPYSPATQYYFLPIRSGKAVWTNPYYDDDLGIHVLSYSKAIYVGDFFVGVTGADVTTEDTTDIIKQMQPYDDGFALLLNADMDLIIRPESIESEHLRDMIPQTYEEVAGQLRRQPSGNFRMTVGEEQYITGFARLNNDWILCISYPHKQAFASIHNLNRVLMILAAVITLLVVGFAITFAISFSRPINIRQNALEAQNREKEILLMYQSRQAKIGEMVGNIAHQWRQPLNSINLVMANMMDTYHDGELDEKNLDVSIRKIEKITGNMSDTISDFTGFLTPAKEIECFDIHDSMLKALSLMEESLQKHNIKINYREQGGCMVCGYVNELTHVLFNVIGNARDAILSEDPPVRQIDIVTRSQGGNMLIQVVNLLCRIDEKDLVRVFDPYFTTKQEVDGTGIGLYISKAIIEKRLNGTIRLHNTQEGVSCEISLPCSQAVHEEDG